MAEPIRVAHVVGKMVGGGMEQVVMNYYLHIDRSRVQFDFVVDSDSVLVPRREIESLGGRVFTVPPYQRVIAYQRALIKLFREQRWKIVHSHENALSVFPLRAAKRAGVPVRIAHSHSTAGRGETTRNAIKWVLRRFANVYPTQRVACSKHAGEWLFGKDADFTVLYNAIDLSEFRFDSKVRDEARVELGISDSVLAIGHIGRFVAQKNQSFILDVFAKVIARDIDAVLVLVGDGPMRGGMEEKAERLGLSGRVLFLGQRDDVARLYQAFDVFCLPSLYEGLGIVAVEAQVAGLRCLLSDRVPREVAISDNTTFLPIRTEQVWSDAISSVVANYRRDIHLEDFANYDISTAARRLEQFYLGLSTASSLRGVLS